MSPVRVDHSIISRYFRRKVRSMSLSRKCLLSIFALFLFAEVALGQNLTGIWNGTYFYPPNAECPAQFVKFWMIVIDDNGGIAGFIKEPNTFGRVDAPWLHSTYKGRSDGASRKISFVKTYDGTAGVSHNVQYSGQLSADGVNVKGEWQIPGSWNGRFTLEKVADTSSGPLSGRWTGTFDYPEGATQPPVNFTLILVHKGGGLAGFLREVKTFGEGNDPWLHAGVKGSFDQAQDTLKFTKSYDGTAKVDHDVLYDGRVSKSRDAVKGRWEIPDVWGADFVMRKQR
jgi:hypothetical protein